MSAIKKQVVYKFVKAGWGEPNNCPELPAAYNYFHPELYLQLIENKAKVKESLKNSDYKPPDISLEKVAAALPESCPDPPQTEFEVPQVPPVATMGTEDMVFGLKRKHPASFSYSSRNNTTAPEKRARLIELETAEDSVSPPPISQFYQKQPETIEDEMELKQNLIAKVNMLRHVHKTMDIPYVSMNQEYKVIKAEYDNLLKTLNICSKQEKYRLFLKAGFAAVEFFLGKVFKLQMEGFAKEQIENIERYDELLLELGEKNYVADAPEKFPVEVRLLGMIVVQAAMFVGLKKLTGGTSSSTTAGGLFDLFSSFMKPQAAQKSPAPQTMPSTSSGMKGPSAYQ